MFNQFSTDWASNSEVMMKNRQTLGAESVSTMNEDSGNLFTNIEFFAAIVAKIKASGLVISLKQILWLLQVLNFFQFFQMGFTL